MEALYEYKGKLYRKLFRAKLKNPQTGLWGYCIVYSPEYSGAVYVRTEWQFRQKFKKVQLK